MDWMEVPKEYYEEKTKQYEKGGYDGVDGVLGSYFSADNKVVLYPENISACSKDLNIEEGDLVEVVRLHEYGHALHCIGWAEFARSLEYNIYGLNSIYGKDASGIAGIHRGSITKAFKEEFNFFRDTFHNTNKISPCPEKEWVAVVFSMLFAASRLKHWPGLYDAWEKLHNSMPKTSAYWIGDSNAHRDIIESSKINQYNGAIFGSFITFWLQPWSSKTLNQEERNEFFEGFIEGPGTGPGTYRPKRPYLYCWRDSKKNSLARHDLFSTMRRVQWMWGQHVSLTGGVSVGACASGFKIDSTGKKLEDFDKHFQVLCSLYEHTNAIEQEEIGEI